ncbi:uncharacterized protein [Physcomitrium patens]|uniref:Uncharacterized protein n=1 Tax=Physcomitrium patens TaxID=3218 RepID=A0A2K1JJC1_PHYPA|nr:uncharacterized protein LOC112291169 [Physcomitrium patens]PNR41426.1 hypothetical protein PHYPA_018829 [Physcomitrium patens]|eukprot:XP_024394025.1 uncharacterized protein LOC112291169 [Physcomitrella patens]
MAVTVSKFSARTLTQLESLMNGMKIVGEDESQKVEAELNTSSGEWEKKEKKSKHEDAVEDDDSASDVATTTCGEKDMKAMSKEVVATDETGSSNADFENSSSDFEQKKHVCELSVMLTEEQKWPERDMFEEVISEDFEKIISVARSEAHVHGIHSEDPKIHGFLHESYQIKNKDVEAIRVPRASRTNTKYGLAFVRLKLKICRLLVSYPSPLGFGRHCKLGTSSFATKLILNLVRVHKEDLHKTIAFNNSEQGVEAIKIPRGYQTSIRYSHVFIHFRTKINHSYVTHPRPLGVDLNVGRHRKSGTFYAASKPGACPVHRHGNASANRRNPSLFKKSLLPGEGTRAAKVLVGRPGKGGLGRHDPRHIAQLGVITRRDLVLQGPSNWVRQQATAVQSW